MQDVDKSPLLSSIIRSLVEEPGGAERVHEYSAPIEFVYDDERSPTGVDLPTSSACEGENTVLAHAVRNAMRRRPTVIRIRHAGDKARIEAALKNEPTDL